MCPGNRPARLCALFLVCAASAALAQGVPPAPPAPRVPEATAPLPPDFARITSSIHSTNHAAVRADMVAWVARHPQDPQAPRGLIWVAGILRGDGQGKEARPFYERVLREAPDSEWALHALKGLSDLDLESHRYTEAIAGYRRLAAQPSEFWKYIGGNALLHALGEQERFHIMLGVLALLLLLGLVRLVRSGGPRSLWPPPLELVLPLPVLLVVLVSAVAQEPAEQGAVVSLVLGAVLLLWSHGAALRARPPQGALRAVHLGLGLLQAVGLLYCALVGNGLWARVVDTIAMGGAE